MKISQQDGDLCCGPRSLAGGAKGEEEISLSANTLEVDAGYLGSTCKPPCEQQGTKVLMKALGRRVGLAALGAGAELCCRHQPGPADIILLGTERVETFPFAPCSVGTQGLLCPSLLHFSLSLRHSRTSQEGRSTTSHTPPQMDLDGLGMESYE